MRSDPDAELSSYDRHIVTRAFTTAQSFIRAARYMHRCMPRVAGRLTDMWAKLFSGVITIAATAIWCGPHMAPSFLGQAVVELNDTMELVEEAANVNPSSDRPQAVRLIVPTLQSMIVGRYPHLVGNDPTHFSASIAREDVLFAMLGGVVDGITGLQTCHDWSSAMLVAHDAPSGPGSWAPMMTPRGDISPALLHTPSHEAVPGFSSPFPGAVSPFPGTVSPFAVGGQGTSKAPASRPNTSRRRTAPAARANWVSSPCSPRSNNTSSPSPP